MGDDEARVEAWVRKKPKRIIQNQAVIVLLGMVAGFSSGVITLFVFILYGMSPIVAPIMLVAWMVSVIIYVGLEIYAWMENRRQS